jgi:hypothetical protein
MSVIPSICQSTPCAIFPAEDVATGANTYVTESSVDKGPTGTLITLFGGITLQSWTQKEAYEFFSALHTYQHDTAGEEKFQYSVMVSSEQDKGSLA